MRFSLCTIDETREGLEVVNPDNEEEEVGDPQIFVDSSAPITSQLTTMSFVLWRGTLTALGTHARFEL